MTLFSLVLAASLASGNVEFEQASVNAAVDIALGQLDARLAERGLATNFLERVMLEDPAACRTRAEAEALCRQRYRDELDRVYRERAKEILSELGSDRAPAEPDAKAMDAVAARHFAAAFAADRTAACAAQAGRIALTVKPDEADLETKGDDEARVWLTDRIANARGLSVFEENLKYISEQIVDPVLADARKERKRQREYLVSKARCDVYSPERLATELEAKLRADVAERNAKCDNPLFAWKVFPQTLRTSLTNAVERRLLRIVEKEIESVPFAIDTNAVRETIIADPVAHRDPTASEGVFRANYAKDILECAIIQAEQSAPAAERAAFGSYVRDRTDSPDLDRKVDARLKRDTLPKWRVARAAIAQAEADRLWPAFADRTWYPEAELADRTAARSDYAAAVSDWRSAPELEVYARAGVQALAESDAAADKSVAAAFDLARNAITAQRAILAEVHPSVLAAAKDLSKGLFTSTPDLAAVTEMLTKQVEQTWSERRVETLWGDGPKPANAEVQHRELFPSVRREIELVARQILEEMEKREETEERQEPKPEEPKPPEDPPPEEPPPEETPPEEEKPEEELCTILFEMKGGEVTAQAKRGSSLVAERKAKATAAGFENAVREVGAVVGREIFKLK